MEAQGRLRAAVQYRSLRVLTLYGSYSGGIGPDPPSYLGTLGFVVAY